MSAVAISIAAEVVTLLNATGSPLASRGDLGTLSNGSTSVTGLTDTSALMVGQGVSGTGVPVGTTIAAIPSATTITLSAQATAGGLASLTFAAIATAARKYSPLVDKNSLIAPAVSVVADNPASYEAQARNRFDGEYPIDVAVQKALSNPETLSEIDPYPALLDRILDYVLSDDGSGNSRRVLPIGKAALMEVSYKAICDPKHLKELQVYTGVIVLTYRLSRVIR